MKINSYKCTYIYINEYIFQLEKNYKPSKHPSVQILSAPKHLSTKASWCQNVSVPKNRRQNGGAKVALKHIGAKTSYTPIEVGSLLD